MKNNLNNSNLHKTSNNVMKKVKNKAISNKNLKSNKIRKQISHLQV
jgi:hypothetical protein